MISWVLALFSFGYSDLRKATANTEDKESPRTVDCINKREHQVVMLLINI